MKDQILVLVTMGKGDSDPHSMAVIPFDCRQKANEYCKEVTNLESKYYVNAMIVEPNKGYELSRQVATEAFDQSFFVLRPKATENKATSYVITSKEPPVMISSHRSYNFATDNEAQAVDAILNLLLVGRDAHVTYSGKAFPSIIIAHCAEGQCMVHVRETIDDLPTNRGDWRSYYMTIGKDRKIYLDLIQKTKFDVFGGVR
jgi:hypothetical protein